MKIEKSVFQKKNRKFLKNFQKHLIFFTKFLKIALTFFVFKKMGDFFIDRSKIVLRSEHAQVERPNNELGGTRPPQVQVQKMLPNVVECIQNMYLILRQDYILQAVYDVQTAMQYMFLSAVMAVLDGCIVSAGKVCMIYKKDHKKY